MIFDPKSIINLDSLVGRLTTFVLHNYDNYVLSSKGIESTFEAKLSLKKKGGKLKDKQYNSEDEEKSYDIDLEVIEFLLSRKYPKGRRKYKGKFSLICLSCEEFGHISTRFPNIEGNDEKKSSKFKGNKVLKSYNDYKNKVKKSCLMAENFDSNDNDEMVYTTIKYESDDELDNTVLISHVIKNDTWIIDSGFSHHMRYKSKFEHMEHNDDGSVRFGNNERCCIKGKGCISLTNELKCDNAY